MAEQPAPPPSGSSRAWPMAGRAGIPAAPDGETADGAVSPPDATGLVPRLKIRWALVGFLAGLVASNMLVVGWVVISDADLEDLGDIPLAVLAIAQAGLWVGMAGVPALVARRLGTSMRDLYGLTATRRDVGVGLGVGVVTQLVVIPLLYWPFFELFGEQDLGEPARELADRADGFGLVLLGLVVVVGAPVVEELFFRGMLLRTLRQRFSAVPAIGISALAFGAAHFQLLQLPALVVVGIVTGWLAERSGRLGPAIWVHGVFNLAAFVPLALDVV